MQGILPLLWPLKQSTIDFLSVPDVGKWWQTHSTNVSVSIAKSSVFRSRRSGNAIFFVLVTTTEACRYSNFDFSNSAMTPSAVYTLTWMLTCIISSGSDHAWRQGNFKYLMDSKTNNVCDGKYFTFCSSSMGIYSTYSRRWTSSTTKSKSDIRIHRFQSIKFTNNSFFIIFFFLLINLWGDHLHQENMPIWYKKLIFIISVMYLVWRCWLPQNIMLYCLSIDSVASYV